VLPTPVTANRSSVHDRVDLVQCHNLAHKRAKRYLQNMTELTVAIAISILLLLIIVGTAAATIFITVVVLPCSGR
jgi:hypothetical protein